MVVDARSSYAGGLFAAYAIITPVFDAVYRKVIRKVIKPP